MGFDNARPGMKWSVMTLKTAIYANDAGLVHFAGDGHPENSKRLSSVLEAMRAAFPENDQKIQWVQARQAADHEILLGHSKTYLDDLKKKDRQLKPGDAPISIDPDTRMSHGSLASVSYGVGAACQAVDDIMAGKYRNAFCVTRPPGHHATKNSSLGFCFFGNLAIAALYALQKRGIRKIAVVDFDVHQGNGTEDIVKENPNILFFSIHQEPLWPYMHHEDKGPHGTINNIAVPVTADPAIYHEIFDKRVIPALEKWKPDFIFVSAGFDAHRDDPPKEVLFNDAPGRQMLLEEDFDLMTKKLVTIADGFCRGRLISVLEGGYNPAVFASCCVAHAKILSGQ